MLHKPWWLYRTPLLSSRSSRESLRLSPASPSHSTCEQIWVLIFYRKPDGFGALDFIWKQWIDVNCSMCVYTYVYIYIYIYTYLHYIHLHVWPSMFWGTGDHPIFLALRSVHTKRFQPFSRHESDGIILTNSLNDNTTEARLLGVFHVL